MYRNYRLRIQGHLRGGHALVEVFQDQIQISCDSWVVLVLALSYEVVVRTEHLVMLAILTFHLTANTKMMV